MIFNIHIGLLISELRRILFFSDSNANVEDILDFISDEDVMINLIRIYIREEFSISDMEYQILSNAENLVNNTPEYGWIHDEEYLDIWCMCLHHLSKFVFNHFDGLGLYGYISFYAYSRYSKYTIEDTYLYLKYTPFCELGMNESFFNALCTGSKPVYIP